MGYSLRSLEKSDIEAISAFTDQWIGMNYYSSEEIEEILQISCRGALNASVGAFDKSDKQNLIGVRLTYAPDTWIEKKGRGLSPQGWKVDAKGVAYFKSLFVSPDFQQMGIGRALSEKSIEVLEQMDTKAIVCHSWLESPGNSSQLYLSKMGFMPVAEHQLYWNEIDYLCTRCAPGRCVCTAMEMIKYLN